MPKRSVRTIIEILEREGRVHPGQLKRSTLQDYFAKQGFSRRHLAMYQQQGIAARRFQQRHRNDLWQSDIKYGPHLPIGENGKLKPTYLVVILDDATRYIVHAAFYHVQTRKVTKVGCISFNGVDYEVGTSYIGMTVTVIYDALDLSSLTIEAEGWEPLTVYPLQIGIKAGQRAKLSEA